MVQLTFALFAAWVLLIGVFGRHTLGWAFDSPVLRRALRTSRFGTPVWLGWTANTVLVSWFVYSRTGGQITAAALLAGSLLLVMGYAAVLLTSLIVEDLQEVFLLVAGKLREHGPLDRWSERTEDEAEAARLRCEISEAMAARHCIDAARRCGSSFSHQARRPGSRHTRQHR